MFIYHSSDCWGYNLTGYSSLVLTCCVALPMQHHHVWIKRRPYRWHLGFVRRGGEDYFVVVRKANAWGFGDVGHQFQEQWGDSLPPRTHLGKDTLRCLLWRESRYFIVTMPTHKKLVK